MFVFKHYHNLFSYIVFSCPPTGTLWTLSRKHIVWSSSVFSSLRFHLRSCTSKQNRRSIRRCLRTCVVKGVVRFGRVKV